MPIDPVTGGLLQSGIGLLGSLFGNSNRNSDIAAYNNAQMMSSALYGGKQIAAADARNAARRFGFNPLTMLGTQAAQTTGTGAQFMPGRGPNLGAIGAMQNAIGLLSPETETTGEAEEDQIKQAERLRKKVERDQRLKPDGLSVTPNKKSNPKLRNRGLGNDLEYEVLGYDARKLDPKQTSEIIDRTNDIEPEPSKVFQPITKTPTPGGRLAPIPAGEDTEEMAKNLAVDMYGRFIDWRENRYERAALDRQRRIQNIGYGAYNEERNKLQTPRAAIGEKPKPKPKVKRKKDKNKRYVPATNYAP